MVKTAWELPGRADNLLSGSATVMFQCKIKIGHPPKSAGNASAARTNLKAFV